MTLTRRLLLHGVVVPLVVIAAALGAVGVALQELLVSAVDQALRAQATVESVSLFDRLDHQPHLHLDRSPLRQDMATAAADSALYDAAGKLLIALPEGTAPAQVAPPKAGAQAVVRDEVGAQGAHGAAPLRVLEVVVPDPQGQPHLLRLQQSLASVDATLRTYWQVALAVGALAAALLLALQLGLLRNLLARLGQLRTQIAQLHEAGTTAAPQQADELQALQAALARATEAIAQTRKAEERLLADAAHELRTPLAAILTDVDVTLRRERTAPELREALQRVREEVDGLGSLASRLLDLTVLRLSGQPEAPALSLDLTALAAQALERWQATATERGAQLRLQAPASLSVRADPAGLQQVLSNLLDNALRYAPQGSEVLVVVGAEPGATAHLWVDDAGPGIPEEAREQVFEPMHRLDRRARGAGLGLAIVRAAARKLGGEAFAAASPAGGARVGIRW